MWKILQAGWSGSRLVRGMEQFALWLGVAWRHCWLGRLLLGFWHDSPDAYCTSRWSRRLEAAAMRWRSAGTTGRLWLEHSYWLQRWPQWLAADMAWLWQGSCLCRLWRKWQQGTTGLTAETTAQASPAAAPPRWRWLVYGAAAVLLAVVLVGTQKWSLLKWLLWGVVAVLVWARPASAVYAVTGLLPFLPILSLAYLLFIAAVARLLQGRRLWPHHSLLRSLAMLFCALALLAALGSENTAAALRYWRYYLAGLIYFVLLLDTLRTEAAGKKLLALGLLAAVAVSGMAIWQYIGGSQTNLSWVDIRVAAVKTRVVGTFDNPNMLAAYLTAWLPFAAAYLLQRQSTPAVRLTNLLICAVLGVALLLTFSRGGWLAAAAALLVVVVGLQPRLLWVVPVLLLLAPFVLPPVIWQRLASIINLEDTSNMVRLYIWNSSAAMFAAHWMSGIGQGLVPFARVYPVYQYGIVPALHAHSLVLQVGVESGALALLVWLGLCVGLCRMASSRWQSAPLGAVATGAALIGHLVHGLFDYTWYDMRLALVFWLLAGLVVAAYGWRCHTDSEPREEAGLCE